MSLQMWDVLYIRTGLQRNAVTFSMSGNCDFPCWEVNQHIIQVCKRYCTAVTTPSHIAGVALQTDKAVILYICICNITCSDYQIPKVHNNNNKKLNQIVYTISHFIYFYDSTHSGLFNYHQGNSGRNSVFKSRILSSGM
jgi:hypothetical protein